MYGALSYQEKQKQRENKTSKALQGHMPGKEVQGLASKTSSYFSQKAKAQIAAIYIYINIEQDNDTTINQTFYKTCYFVIETMLWLYSARLYWSYRVNKYSSWKEKECAMHA